MGSEGEEVMAKNKMGTIISDSSHFTARYRSIMQCQVTVITTGRSPVFGTCELTAGY